jgi:hypothetical protein
MGVKRILSHQGKNINWWFRFVFWDVLPCKIIVDRRFRGTYCLHHQGDEIIRLFYAAVGLHPRRQIWTSYSPPWELVISHRLMVFENRVLRRIFGPERDEITGEWRTLHNKELHDLYSFQMSLSRSSQGDWCGRGMWHAWERREKCTRIWWQSPKNETTTKTKVSMREWDENGSWEDWVGRVWSGFSCSGYGPVTGSCEYNEESPDSDDTHE